MSVQLLDKTRKINKLLHNNTEYGINIDCICKQFGSMIYSNVLIIDTDGSFIGVYEDDNVPVIGYVPGMTIGDRIDSDLNERFVSVLSTKENVNLELMGFEGDNYDHYDSMIIPVDISGERFGTVFVYRLNNSYEADDIILGEYVATIVAMEMLHNAHIEDAGDSIQKKAARTAACSLSMQELKAAGYMFKELTRSKGVLVTSRLADKYNITRSTLVNAIKKLAGAGVISSRSMGTKGTAIEVNNRYIIEALNCILIEE